MKARKDIALVLTGAAIGVTLTGPAQAAAELLAAQRIGYPVYVDGRSVDLDAYAIEGRTYVQLRDMGKAVGFNVYWDGAVQIQSNTAYTGEAPPKTDYSAEANPAIFTGSYTKELYNVLRETVLTGKSDVYDKAIVPNEMVWKVDAAAVAYNGYHIQSEGDGLASLYTRQTDGNKAAAEALRPFLDSLNGKSDYEKAYAVACEVSKRLEYKSTASTSPVTLFTTEGVHYGNCMSYAHGFKFLCTLLDIPCILVHSDIHQWNEIYLDGRWYGVDVGGFDIGYTERGYDKLLADAQDFQGKIYAQTEPELTLFAKEILVPGSTK